MFLSWRKGHHTSDVHIIVKDSVFEASYAWQHYSQTTLQLVREGSEKAGVSVTKLNNFIGLSTKDKTSILQHVPFFLAISTDGGHDHKITNISTRVALLGMVLMLELASLVAFRNAPDCSYMNPVERVMSLLNLAL